MNSRIEHAGQIDRVKGYRRGGVLVYCTIAMTAFLGICSFAVDYGRVQVAKSELQNAADACAHYAAYGIDDSTAYAKATTAASENTVDGTPLTIQASDVTVGVWHAPSGKFKTNGSGTPAVQVTVSRTQARGNAVPLLFAKILGAKFVDIHATSVATYTAPTTTTLTAPSKGDPWLAGMPNGTTANGYDSAPNNSPTQITGITLTPGSSLNFSFTGSASYYPGTQPFDPDGNPGWIINNYAGREHGKSQLNAPLTAVVAVFLDDTQPNLAGGPPPDLDFSTPTSRDFATLSPQLRQPFFVGNGLRADGVTMQDFVVPPGATRLYLGIMDGQQWSDNAGALTSTVTHPPQIIVVK